MGRKAGPYMWCSRAEGAIPHGVEFSTCWDPEEQVAGRSEGVGGGFVSIDGFVCE